LLLKPWGAGRRGQAYTVVSPAGRSSAQSRGAGAATLSGASSDVNRHISYRRTCRGSSAGGRAGTPVAFGRDEAVLDRGLQGGAIDERSSAAYTPKPPPI